MAKKNKPMKEIKGPYECPSCHSQYDILPPCPKCQHVFEVGIYPTQMIPIKEFLKKNPLNKVELFYFGDQLLYEFIPYKKPATKGTKKQN